jgi:sensor domain CHASE-containing protein
MATVDRVWRSPAAVAASRVLDEDVEASLEGSGMHPDGTVFIPEELATPDVVEGYRRDGSHVAIVSDVGSIELLRPRLRTEEKLIILALVATALLLWITRSRAIAV